MGAGYMARHYHSDPFSRLRHITVCSAAHPKCMIRRCASNAALLALSLFAFCFVSSAQEKQAPSEIPIERCDVLPVVKVRVDGAEMRFLLDTAATTVLNLKTFSSGRS